MATDFQRNNEQAACALVDRIVGVYVDPEEAVKDKNGNDILHPDTGEKLMKPPEPWISNEVAAELKEQVHDNPFDEETDMKAGEVEVDLQVSSRYGGQHKVNTTHHGRPFRWRGKTRVNGLEATWMFTGARGWICEDSEGHRIVRLPNGGWRAEKDEKKKIKAKGKKKKKIEEPAVKVVDDK